jgi:hypothetical protein
MRLSLLLLLFVAASVWAQSPPAWVEKSNQNAQLLIEIMARYSPEDAAAEGVPGLDEQVSSSKPDEPERFRRDMSSARDELKKRLAAEKDPLVRQDLEILIAQADRDIRASQARERILLPYDDVAGTIFYGIKSLLDEQIAADRRPASVVRLRKYTGLDPAYEPLTVQAEKRYREKLKSAGLVGPSKLAVNKNLENTQAYITGIGLLLEKYKLAGYQEAFAKLKEQLTAYDTFVRTDVLPQARDDFRLPPELYTISLENYGIDYAPDELTRLAHEMCAIAKPDAIHRGQGRERPPFAVVRLSCRDRRSEERSDSGRSGAAALSEAAGGNRRHHPSRASGDAARSSGDYSSGFGGRDRAAARASHGSSATDQQSWRARPVCAAA